MSSTSYVYMTILALYMYMTTLKPDVYMTIKRDRKGEGAVEELVASSDILCMHVNSGTLYIHDNPDNLCT